MTTAIVSVVYPAGTKFDMDYYLATHMPLVQLKWAPLGLKNWKVIEFTNPEAPYSVQAVLEWEDATQFAKASATPEAKEVFDDIPNFSDQKPTVLSGTVKGAQSW
ncbi:hypothetical protein GGS23DRAFT_588786 [Durotheca rogersii]|uniref:uncharacterized protein n=1 Tax=Durotheca rogersii TaxID=419775 RepID=UPI0022204D41|nr:uncharacterized protein GGS23DRAFT_588786 [Durotheca rogersii]KAI5856699.1 hypothetical protein GGS23DRAFT_588786 [Durotheca rogersii]